MAQNRTLYANAAIFSKKYNAQDRTNIAQYRGDIHKYRGDIHEFRGDIHEEYCRDIF